MSDKKRERILLDEVLELYNKINSNNIIEYESPDFIILLNDTKLGIEVVDYIRGENENGSLIRRNENYWKRLAIMARNKYKESNTEPLSVKLLAFPNANPKKEIFPLLLNELVNIVRLYLPQELFGKTHIGFESMEGTVLERIISSINIMRVKNNRLDNWSFIGVGIIDISEKEIQQIINAKEEKIVEYKQKCNKLYLLIVADGIYISSNISFRDEILKYKYISSFDHILLYDRSNRKVYELNTSNC